MFLKESRIDTMIKIQMTVYWTCFLLLERRLFSSDEKESGG